MKLKTRSIYWLLTLFLKQKYPLYWVLTGTLFLALRVLFLHLFKAQVFIWTELFFAYFIVAALPAAVLYAADIFENIPVQFSGYFDINSKALSDWANQEGYKIFDIDYKPMVLASIWVNMLGTLTLLALAPFKSPIFEILNIISLQPVFFICGYMACILTRLAIAQHRLVNIPISFPFLNRGHRVVGKLSGYVYTLATAGLVEYLGLFVAVRLGPIRNSNLMAVWLIGLAITPILIFAFGVYQIHLLQREIKLKNLDAINLEVQKIFHEFKMTPSKDVAEKFLKIIEAQDRIEAIKEWPIALGSILTLIMALAAAIGQILVSINTLLN